MRVVISAGGTGGHIYPALAIINKIKEMLNQKAIVEGQGWCSCYICIPCVENWLEESGQVEVGGTAYECRNCGDEVQKYLPYCPWCGQMQDWSDVDES